MPRGSHALCLLEILFSRVGGCIDDQVFIERGRLTCCEPESFEDHHLDVSSGGGGESTAQMIAVLIGKAIQEIELRSGDGLVRFI